LRLTLSVLFSRLLFSRLLFSRLLFSRLLFSLLLFSLLLFSLLLLNGLSALDARPQPLTPESPDFHQPFAEALKQAVSDRGIDYERLRSSPDFKVYLQRLVAPLPSHLTRSASLAYWINAYNALTLSHVLSFPRIESVKTAVKDAPPYTFFTQKIHRVAGALYALDQIEHQVLRPRFKDPRIHMAINCASVSCPSLRDRPYPPQGVDQALDEAARRFINDSTKNKIEEGASQVSKIFEWFTKDFEATGGARAFIARYVDADRGALILDERRALVYLPYDWALNQVRIKRAALK
jgi:hypothetical protein